MINDRYKIKKKLGQGRSSVFLCSDQDKENKELAIKILSKDADKEERFTFQKEFITLHRFEHPNIITVNDFGTIVKKENDEDIEIGSKYFTLEHFNGNNLLDYEDLNNENELSKIITQLCSAIYYFHQSNYIYYDLKPENILIKKIDNEPIIKLIDFGFIQNVNDNNEKSIRGTAEYIAPELLKNTPHDNRVDLYSLGMILYQIIYKKFPFETKDELSIYKAQLEEDFIFEETNFSDKLLNITKKLLEKEPNERYQNALHIIEDLNGPINKNISVNWTPAKVFSNRNDVINILNTYIKDDSSSEVFVIKGFEGGGKTALANELFFNYENAVLIRNDRTKSGLDLIILVLRNILYKGFVYPKLDNETINEAEKILKNPGPKLIDNIKAIFNKITKTCDLILIFDDFNLYDNFTLEILKDIIPIFQVNKKKIILTEGSDFDYKSDFLFNLREINLTPFTDVQVKNLIDKSFTNSFPKDELNKIILLYADLLPGNIVDFIKDILQLDIINFSKDGAKIDVKDDIEYILKSSHDKIYELRLSPLSEKERKAVDVLSIFRKNIDKNLLGSLLEDHNNDIIKLLEHLKNNNIISNTDSSIQFTSESLKKYIYSKIEDKKGLHLFAGNHIKEKYPNFDRNELATQFELAEKYETGYQILKEEIKAAEEISAYSYQKSILKHLLTLPLGEKSKTNVEIELSHVLKTLNESKECLELTRNILSKNIDTETSTGLEIQEGICLIGIGELNEGKDVLISILNKIEIPALQEEVKLEIAYAEFDLNNYDSAEQMCNNIISQNISDKKTRARTYNLLALIEIYSKNNIDKAITFFNSGLEIYSELNSILQASKMGVNLGNIYNIKGEYDKALEFWDNALESNNSIGNLEQEAKILLGYGAYYYTNFNFEKAIVYYTRAYDIFISFGDQNGQGIVLTNLAESYLPLCEYQKCFDTLSKSLNLFKNLQNIEEQAEVYFLIGKLYYLLGNLEKLKNIIKEYEIVLSNGSLSEKHQNNISLLNQLNSMLSGEGNQNVIIQLQIIRDKFLELDDKYHYARVNFLLIEQLIKREKYTEALEYLNDKNFIEITEPNLLNAEREFLLALISKSNNNFELESPLELLESTYKQLKDESITELTWKVLFELANIYFERGNIAKANNYASYAKALIYFIAENIKDENFKKNYLNFPDRKNAINELSLIDSKA